MIFPVRAPHLHVHTVARYKRRINRPVGDCRQSHLPLMSSAKARSRTFRIVGYARGEAIECAHMRKAEIYKIRSHHRHCLQPVQIRLRMNTTQESLEEQVAT